MQITQFDSWYWTYHADAKRQGFQPKPQADDKVQRAYRNWCANPKTSSVVKAVHGKPKARYIKRPEGRMNRPLVNQFVFTGEPLNPWRCGLCATKAHKKQADKQEPIEVGEHGDLPQPECCRKCGMDYYR